MDIWNIFSRSQKMLIDQITVSTKVSTTDVFEFVRVTNSSALVTKLDVLLCLLLLCTSWGSRALKLINRRSYCLNNFLHLFDYAYG